MVRTLLVRGMLVGCFAGLLVFGFSKVFGEPQVDRAIAFEAAMDAAKAASSAARMTMDQPEPELVSRRVQAGLGLATGVIVYCTALGGLFALVFAFANGRLGRLRPRTVSALLGAAGLVAVYIVPVLKYPANPPAVGLPDTIGHRTALFFAMLVWSVASMAAATLLRQRLLARCGGWSATLISALAFLVAATLASLVLPPVDEVPDGFPAVVLWNFRIVSLGMQVILWTTLGLGFGWMTERAAQRSFGFARGTIPLAR